MTTCVDFEHKSVLALWEEGPQTSRVLFCCNGTILNGKYVINSFTAHYCFAFHNQQLSPILNKIVLQLLLYLEMRQQVVFLGGGGGITVLFWCMFIGFIILLTCFQTRPEHYFLTIHFCKLSLFSGVLDYQDTYLALPLPTIVPYC